MPVNKNALIRYKFLDKLLSDRYHYYDIHDLVRLCNEALERRGFKIVSKRCIEKDIEELQFEPFCADVEHFRINGKRCIRYKNVTYSIFQKKLTNDEENLLSEVLNTIGQFDGINNFEWIDSLKKSLDIEEHKKIIYFSSNPYLKNSNLLGSLFSVISNKQVIKLSYHNFKNTQIRHIIFNAYLLKQFNDRWYVIGSEENDDFILNFALDRIDYIELLPEKQYQDCQEDLEERFEDIVGVTVPDDKKVEKILLWINDKGFPYIDTKPLHGSQRVLNNVEQAELQKQYSMFEDGHFIELECMINYELIQSIMMNVEDIVVLKPISLMKNIKNILVTQIEKYKKLK